MLIEEIVERMRTYRELGGFMTNYITGMVADKTRVNTVESGNNLVFWCPERFRTRCFYAGCETKGISELLIHAPEGSVLETVYREDGNNPDKKMIEEGGFELRDTSVRYSYTYHTRLGDIPEHGRRALLQKLYNPEFGEFATLDDLDELFQIHREIFNPQLDEVMTLEEWEQIIKNRECILVRVKNRIVTYYVFRIEKNKLYSHVSVNKGPANYLYNIERRIYDECWDNGIRTNYWWVSKNNKVATGRLNDDFMKAVQSASYLYNDIFIQGGKQHDKYGKV